jgi:Tfp pilus assembly protein PilF
MGARRLYLLMELARNRDDLTAQTAYVDLLRTSFPHSQWLARRFSPAATCICCARIIRAR